jgi:hypothetical protein
MVPVIALLSLMGLTWAAAVWATFEEDHAEEADGARRAPRRKVA